MTTFALNRRGALAAGAALATLPFVSSRSAASGEKKPCARFAHLTDIHITKDRKAPAGVAAMFGHLLGRKGDKPEFLIDSGDTVMDLAANVTGAKAAEQIDLWKAAIKGVNLPLFACLGNHDVWSGKEPTDAIPADRKGFKLMTGVLGMPAPYYSFDRAGWHFIMLNSIDDWPKGMGYLTKEQFTWLKDDLKKTPREKPICVVSHLPIVSVTSTLYGDATKKGNQNVVPGVWQHSDCWAISEVFRRYPNVKLCLSGHMHTCDRVEYRGVWYICGGAVSGAWWDGSEYGFPPCYGLVTLYPDGGFDYEFVDYGWSIREWKGKQLAL
jgi:3',5'-cyclic-AMP phosphodiesterase